MLIANGLRKVDMQDLLVFLQVHQRQNLVEVAEHLNLSPSTVSYCLKKLRQAFDDELFIATRGGMQPTHKSRAMLHHVEEMLARINACHAAQGSFDPRGEPRTFTLCAPEYVELLILPALLRRLAANGPRIGLDIRRLGPELPTEALLDGQVDLVFDFGPEYHRPAPELQALALFSDELLCVQDRAQPRHERLELDEFCRRRFVFPTPLDASNANLVDTWLRRQGRSREVAARANSTITFSGEVTDQTCQVAVNGFTDPTVILDSVPVSALDGAVGRSAGETAFTLQLTDCVAPTADEHFTTLFQATNPSAAGNLVNTAASGATGVALQLLDSVGGNPVDLAGGAAVPAGDIVLANGATSTSYDYAVQYVSEAATVTPGPVLGAVTYTLRYE